MLKRISSDKTASRQYTFTLLIPWLRISRKQGTAVQKRSKRRRPVTGAGAGAGAYACLMPRPEKHSLLTCYVAFVIIKV